MSTRQPFVPTRAPSRVGSLSSSTQDKPSDGRFDFVTSLNDTQAAENPRPQSDSVPPANDRTSPTNASTPSIISGINKPLNLAGFGKRRNKPDLQGFAAAAAKPRRSFERTGRPRSPDGTQDQRPFTPFVTQSLARAPRHSSPSRLQTSASANEFSSNQAHISTSRVSGDDSGAVGDHLGPHAHNSGAVPNLRILSRPSLERIPEAATEDDSGGEVQYLGVGKTVARLEAQVQGSLRRPSKRAERPEPEVEDELDYGIPGKRYRTDHVAHGRDMEDPRYDGSSPRSSPMYPRDSEEPGRPAQHPQRGLTEFDGGQYTHPQPDTVTPEDNALRRLLGQELDKVVEEHLDAYNEAKKKWSECSMEEWQAGADEMAAKFAKMIDFVKEHMTTKMGLYTMLHANVTNHRAVLSDREKMLKEAQEELVRSGGKVVGATSATSKRLSENTTAK